MLQSGMTTRLDALAAEIAGASGEINHWKTTRSWLQDAGRAGMDTVIAAGAGLLEVRRRNGPWGADLGGFNVAPGEETSP